MKILGISTSTPRGSAALIEGTELLGQLSYRDEMAHAERLFATVEQLLAEQRLRPGAIDAVACDVGPGSFTGVRVAVASARGMALGLQIPLVGVRSLAALAAAGFAAAEQQVQIIAAVIDAKRGELFFGAYDRRGQIALAAGHVEVAEIEQALQPCLGRGDVALVGRQSEMVPGAGARRLRGPGCELPDAEWIARCAAAQLAAGTAPANDTVEPVYLRAPDATPPPAKRSCLK